MKRRLALILIGVILVLGPGCKEKEPDPVGGHKVTRPKLPEMPKKP
jgi:hypothetical protein